MRKPTAIAAAALAVAASLLAPTSANAAGEPFTIWLDKNFSGPSASMNDHLPSYGNLVYRGTSTRIDNSASSAANYAPGYLVMAYRDALRGCDRTAVFLLFLPKNQTSATASWNYPDLAAKGFDNTISGHCFQSVR